MTSMGAKVVKDHPDYRLISARVLDTLADYKEVNVFLRGIFANMGFKSDWSSSTCTIAPPARPTIRGQK